MQKLITHGRGFAVYADSHIDEYTMEEVVDRFVPYVFTRDGFLDKRAPVTVSKATGMVALHKGFATKDQAVAFAYGYITCALGGNELPGPEVPVRRNDVLYGG